jgi:DNA gyrase/topoisomerase IV subunit B
MKNEEIKNIIDILGLKPGIEYNEDNIKSLRYGHLMIMADQDHDGSHIKVSYFVVLVPIVVLSKTSVHGY